MGLLGQGTSRSRVHGSIVPVLETGLDLVLVAAKLEGEKGLNFLSPGRGERTQFPGLLASWSTGQDLGQRTSRLGDFSVKGHLGQGTSRSRDISVKRRLS